MNRANYHLLTGAPGSGKSTLLLELAARGYPTVGEPARRAEFVLEHVICSPMV